MKIAILISLLLLDTNWIQEVSYEKQRERMVKIQMEARGINDKSTLRAMRKVPRHLFVPADQGSRAYNDSPLPIGYGQTISQPYIVAYMTQLIRPDADHRVLEVGTGSGYQAAVLAEIVENVYTIEIIKGLATAAHNRLTKLGYQNAKVKNADGYDGWKEFAPFDAIVVTAASEYIPPPLIEQLKEGGKMVIPVGSPFMVQQLMLVEKTKGKKIRTTSLMPVRFVPFTRGN